MGAVFAVLVTVSGEGLSTGWTDEIIHRFPFYEVEMAVPPLVPANVRTKLLFLATGILDDSFSTAQTGLFSDPMRRLLCRRARQPVPPAEGFNRAFAYAGKLADFLVSVSVPAVSHNGVSLGIRHILHLRNLGRRSIIVISYAFLISKREKGNVLPKNLREISSIKNSLWTLHAERCPQAKI